MSSTSLSDVSAFLEVAEKKDYFNAHTIQSRRVAFNKFFEILDEDQRTVEYVSENLDVIKARFTNRYPDVRGNTIEVYAQRVRLVLNDFLAWKTDRAAWERDIATRQSNRATNGDGEKRARPERAKPSAPRADTDESAGMRAVTIPLPSGAEIEIKIPRELSVSDLKRVLWALLPYAQDWDPNVSPRTTFPQLETNVDPLRQ